MTHDLPTDLLRDPTFATNMMRDAIRRNDISRALACFEFAPTISPHHARILLPFASPTTARRLARVLLDDQEPAQWLCFNQSYPLTLSIDDYNPPHNAESDNIDHLALPLDLDRNPTLLICDTHIPLHWNDTLPLLLACDIAQRGLNEFQKIIPGEPRLQRQLDTSRKLALGQATLEEYEQANADAEPLLRTFFRKLRDVISNPNRFSFAFSAISMTAHRPIDLNEVSNMVAFSFANALQANDAYFAERAQHALLLSQYYLGEIPSFPPHNTQNQNNP